MDIKLLEVKLFEMKAKLYLVLFFLIFSLQEKKISKPEGIVTETFHNETKETPVFKK